MIKSYKPKTEPKTGGKLKTGTENRVEKTGKTENRISGLKPTLSNPNK